MEVPAFAGQVVDRLGPRITLLLMGLSAALFTGLTALGGKPGLGSVLGVMPALLIAVGFKLQVDTWRGLLALQVSAATLLVLLPAILMGTVMPLVLMWAAGLYRGGPGGPLRNSTTPAGAVGRSYAVNTIGAIAGSVATAFVLIPLAGTRFTILFTVSLCLALAAVAYLPKRDKADRAIARAGAVGISAVLIFLTFIAGPKLNVDALSIGAYDSYVRVLARARERE